MYYWYMYALDEDSSVGAIKSLVGKKKAVSSEDIESSAATATAPAEKEENSP
jgi:hypothetical protein